MYEILVAGGGFAGVWSAAAAVRAARLAGIADGELSVTLVSDGDDLVIRPRLYEADPESKRLPLKGILGPIGVEVVAATVTDIDPAARTARTVDAAGGVGVLRYDRLVLATGSRVIRPSFPGADLVHDIDTVGAAAALEAHLHRLPGAPEPGRFTAVVIGAGFTGLEIATELVDRLRAIAAPHGLAETVRVVLVDRGETIGSGYAPDARAVIADALTALGVTQRLGVSATAVDEAGVELSDGSRLTARTVVWTAGVRASDLAAHVSDRRDGLGRLAVDEFLRVPDAPDVYAAGDTGAATAEAGNPVTQSCQHAMPMGKFAGHNAVADLLGVPLAAFRPDPYVTCLDLGSAGAVTTRGFERTLNTVGEIAKRRKLAVNEVWIYPPVDDAEELLRQADFRVSARRSV
ncbi:FAD-dependent oxidoreductase [Nocardia terpenica]|uniref:NAD(P)/FAD-dependent oxidoreductase n=1 Tax=Nocardia terpenica TaxID=455432 RepID=UPI001892F457|nr:FAD-dependent oxidoreductase [Nocardia terpenica]MBF6064110.1 FAD-dependent oxidoreductase [Nocardia terpenica]MBF6106443.1 FAD-dependent oxidoreductase [Nocardia terpenica]MBF6113728.1 FAD-dependent oxidoreductase [Nocardia terpenica]MBF6120648.1 FAD-dependent oxidoreductase [Nocardia terpenica]MBF6154695.1 FAD-dependent oxidoreductase [Nocardia terpenica]